MNNPGIIDLGDVALTTALTGSVITEGVSAQSVDQAFIDRLEGMTAVTIWARLAYGSAGTTVKLYIQTSFDSGVTWVDIACIAFGVASETQIVNLSGLTAKTTPATPTDGTLADDTCLDGVLGDRLRAKVTSTGTYATNTTLSVRAAVR